MTFNVEFEITDLGMGQAVVKAHHRGMGVTINT